MRDETNPGGVPPPATLENRLRALPEETVPDDLLGRCLATTRRLRFSTSARWPLRVAAALLVFLASAIVVVRTRPVDAAEMLKSVKAAWTKVDASHQVFRMKSPEGTRTEETWFVRNKGQRKEVRSSDELIGVVVDNGRWEFRWDVRGKLVAAWSTSLADLLHPPRASGLVLDREGFVKWAETHRGTIHIENDTLAGRPARKVVVKWPVPEGGGPAEPASTVWFDPDSLLPLKQRSETMDGIAIETTIDYPAPGAVKEDLFQFTMPRDVVLEINDPDLGRQVYSEGQQKGGER